jgi:hypothetical protein
MHIDSCQTCKNIDNIGGIIQQGVAFSELWNKSERFFGAANQTGLTRVTGW